MINCLIVDDEQHALHILIHYIKNTPFLHLVAATTNPMEALELTATQRIDLLFVDIQMPVMSGIELVRKIPGNSRIILTSAYSESAGETPDPGVLDYLLKPIPLPRFLTAVNRAFNAITSASIATPNGIAG